MALTNEAYEVDKFESLPVEQRENSERELQEKKSKWCRRYAVNRVMIPAKIIYFLEYAKASCHWEYPMLFFIDIGLTPVQAGIINGLRYVGSFIGAPLLGLLADKKQCHRNLVMCLCFASIIANCLQPLVPYLVQQQSTKNCSLPKEVKLASPTPSSDFPHLLYQVFRTNSDQVSCIKYQVSWNISNGYCTHPKHKNRHYDSKTKLFALMLPVVMISSSLDGSTMTFADYGVLKRIRTLSPHSNIGLQRGVAPAGHALGTTFASVVITYVHLQIVSPYARIFIVYICTTSLLVLAYYFLYRGLPEERVIEENRDQKDEGNEEPDATQITCTEENQSKMKIETEENIKMTLSYALGQWRTWFFLLTIIIVGEQIAFAFSFTFLYLKEMGAQPLLFGYSSIVNASTATIFFILSERIVKLIGGALNGMALSCSIWGVRFLALSYMYNPHYVLLTSLTNGICCSLFVYSYMHFIRESYPTSIQTTMCGITNALYYSLSFVLASFINGPLYMHFGARKLYRARSAVCILWSFVVFVYGFAVKLKVRKTENKPNSCRF